MIILDMPQGSLDWIVARLWRLTASEAKKNITSTGALSKSEAAYAAIDKLIAGIELANALNNQADKVAEMDDWQLNKFMAHYTGDKFKGSVHTERGHDFEPDALAAMSEIVGEQFMDVGMCLMGDDLNSVVSCSPDGALGRRGNTFKAGGEVKSVCLCNYYRIVTDNVLPAEHTLQVHFSMAVCGVDTWHYGAFFKGKPLFHKKVKRDSFTDKVEQSLNEFKGMYRERFDLVHDAIESITPKEKELF